MKDFANRKTSKKIKTKNKKTFGSKRANASSVSKKTIIFLLSTSFFLCLVSIFYFKTEISSIKPKSASNSVIIDFPTSLLEGSVLIEEDEMQKSLSCEYFVQIGAYGNKKYAIEAQDMLKSEIQDISINDVYSTLNPGKLLNSVITGPYKNRSAANNAKEKITRKGFDPRLRTTCKQK
mgnify:CR=1 FL=1|tara:strand:+ start:1242 stop:1775 length:534 start_codon:yes stop_codon:yes gene_type:complete